MLISSFLLSLVPPTEQEPFTMRHIIPTRHPCRKKWLGDIWGIFEFEISLSPCTMWHNSEHRIFYILFYFKSLTDTNKYYATIICHWDLYSTPIMTALYLQKTERTGYLHGKQQVCVDPLFIYKVSSDR
jgi:hypothetical protein